MAGGTRTQAQNSGKTAKSHSGGAESGAIAYSELHELLQIWQSIPNHKKEIALDILKALKQG